ncbi:hypothetical protein CPB83DRAFT_846288 [Crepidotus variabilis]|uniref:Uncharacterized protein n=1 Tax=Crepidotus variabilis TaxID=179855 RepID=A0A9P6EMX3_9AGAR|nr:hypothetical protein CPB83DRAFT_846288 [Crepidotus variabilis]
MPFVTFLKRQSTTAKSQSSQPKLEERNGLPVDHQTPAPNANSSVTLPPVVATTSLSVATTTTATEPLQSTSGGGANSVTAIGVASTSATTTIALPEGPKPLGLALATTSELLNTCQSLADLAPVPGLKIAVGVVGQLLKLLETKRRNDDSLKKVIRDILDFISVVSDACARYPQNIPPELAEDVDNFVRSLQHLQGSCNAYFRRGFFHRFVFATSWQNELSGFKENMAIIRQHFNMKNQVHNTAMLDKIHERQTNISPATADGEVDASFHNLVCDEGSTVYNRVGLQEGPPLALSTAFTGARFGKNSVIMNNVGHSSLMALRQEA